MNRRTFISTTAIALPTFSAFGLHNFNSKRADQTRVMLLEIDRPTLNNRIYPLHVVKYAIEKYKTDFINNKKAFVMAYDDDLDSFIDNIVVKTYKNRVS